MSKYKHFTPALFKADNADVVFIEDAGGIRRHSFNKDADQRFADGYEELKDEMSFDDFTTGFSYYNCDEGEYSGENKKRIDAVVAKMKYPKVRVRD